MWRYKGINIMMRQIQISIIVPIYNVAQYLEKCIVSIINQTYHNLQIILVDDGSTDGSSQICDEFKSRDDRIVVIHKGNGGLVNARKSGIQIATGDYIGYVDGDDWIEPDMYEKMLCCMFQNMVDMVEIQYFLEAGTQVKCTKSKLSYGRHITEELIPVMLCDKDFNECRLQPYVWSKLYKRHLLLKHQLEVDACITCGEDMAVVYPYLLDCRSIYVMNYTGYHYVQRENSMTNIVHEKENEQNKALIRYLKGKFERNRQYASVMIQQLNQYTKSMLLIRNMGFFDSKCGQVMLKPFKDIRKGDYIAIYGAGRMGKNLYRYFEKKGVHIVAWGDKEYMIYQQLGMPVLSPEDIVNQQSEFDKLIVGVSSRNVAENIMCFLSKKGLQEEKLVWLSEEFIDFKNDILQQYLEEESI